MECNESVKGADPTEELTKGYCEIRTEYDENGTKTDTYYNKNGNEVDGK